MQRIIAVIGFAATLLMAGTANAQLKLHFIYVGQGDLTVIECPGSQKYVVVDAGSSQDSATAKKNIAAYLPTVFTQNAKIEYVLTHNHSDHKNLFGEVGKVASSRNMTEEAVIGAGASTFTKQGGVKQPVQADACHNSDVKFHILASATPGVSSGVNNQSTVVRVEYGGKSALLVGDAEKDLENWMLGNGNIKPLLPSTILKVGHHGSLSSSTTAFLDVVKPKEAYISAGRHGSYSHPRCKTLENLNTYVQAPETAEAERSLFCYTAGGGTNPVKTTKRIFATRPGTNGDFNNYVVTFEPSKDVGHGIQTLNPAGNDAGDVLEDNDDV